MSEHWRRVEAQPGESQLGPDGAPAGLDSTDAIDLAGDADVTSRTDVADGADGADVDGPEDPPEAASWTIPPAPSPGARSRTGAKHFVLGSLVGGLVGALVAGGIVVATRDDSASKTVRVVQRAVPAGQSRNTSVFAQPQDIQGVLQSVEPGVVAITTGGATDSGLFGGGGSGGGSGGGAGTGFVVSPQGAIVTNSHVVEGAGGRIEVSFADGTKKPATVLGTDASIDLAVLKVEGTNLPVAKLGDSNALQVGDEVIAIGNALALEGGPSVTRGIVSAVNRQIDEQSGARLYNMLQTDAAINPGNSGGPLVNSKGEVVGINTAIADPGSAQNVGFAIAISSVRDAIDQLAGGKNVQLPYLGVKTQDLTAASATELGVKVSAGAVVREVSAGGPAAGGGIKVGDVITKVGDVKVTSAGDVGAAVRRRKAGDKVAVTVQRGDKEQIVEVTLGVRPSSN